MHDEFDWAAAVALLAAPGALLQVDRKRTAAGGTPAYKLMCPTVSQHYAVALRDLDQVGVASSLDCLSGNAQGFGPLLVKNVTVSLLKPEDRNAADRVAGGAEAASERNAVVDRPREIVVAFIDRRRAARHGLQLARLFTAAVVPKVTIGNSRG